MPYTPHPLTQPGYGNPNPVTPKMLFNPHLPPPVGRCGSDDQKEWPTFISSFRDMVHNVVPSDAQRHAFLKQPLSSEVRSYIAEYLKDTSTYYEALEELKKPQFVARSHLMTLMNLPTIRDDDSHGLAKLNRTLDGAMHATGG
jgi:hypothetical protein